MVYAIKSNSDASSLNTTPNRAEKKNGIDLKEDTTNRDLNAARISLGMRSKCNSLNNKQFSATPECGRDAKCQYLFCASFDWCTIRTTKTQEHGRCCSLSPQHFFAPKPQTFPRNAVRTQTIRHILLVCVLYFRRVIQSWLFTQTKPACNDVCGGGGDPIV